MGSAATLLLTPEGFRAGVPSRRSPVERRASRERSYELLRNARLRWGAGSPAEGYRLANEAVAESERADDPPLVDWARRVQFRQAILAGDGETGDRIAAELIAHGDAASAVAWEAGNAWHLVGETSRAVAWYGKGFGLVSEPPVGRQHYEF